MNFKVGDKVIRTTCSFNQLKVGDIATVVKLDADNNVFVTNDIITKDCNNHSSKCPGAYSVFPEYLRLITPLEQLI